MSIISDDKKTGYYNISIRDYHNTQREIDYLQHSNGTMKRELEEIMQLDIYKLRAELKNMESQLYSMFEKMQEILKAADQHDKDKQV
jgi:septation ring formation regulator EzrA